MEYRTRLPGGIVRVVKIDKQGRRVVEYEVRKKKAKKQ